MNDDVHLDARGDFLAVVWSRRRAVLLQFQHAGFETELLFRTQDDISVHSRNMCSLSTSPLTNLSELEEICLFQASPRTKIVD